MAGAALEYSMSSNDDPPTDVTFQRSPSFMLARASLRCLKSVRDHWAAIALCLAIVIGIVMVVVGATLPDAPDPSPSAGRNPVRNRVMRPRKATAAMRDLALVAAIVALGSGVAVDSTGSAQDPARDVRSRRRPRLASELKSVLTRKCGLLSVGLLVALIAYSRCCTSRNRSTTPTLSSVPSAASASSFDAFPSHPASDARQRLLVYAHGSLYHLQRITGTEPSVPDGSDVFTIGRLYDPGNRTDPASRLTADAPRQDAQHSSTMGYD